MSQPSVMLLNLLFLSPRPGRCGFLTAPEGKKSVESNNFLKLNDPTADVGWVDKKHPVGAISESRPLTKYLHTPFNKIFTQLNRHIVHQQRAGKPRPYGVCIHREKINRERSSLLQKSRESEFPPTEEGRHSRLQWTL